ncbi:unnamed protein product [Sphagnum balticum]
MESVVSDDGLMLAPFTLFPSPFSSSHFHHAKHIQTHINTLMHNIAWDQQFLSSSLEKVIKVDDFTEKLYDIYLKVMKEGLSQSTGLGIFRSDYMMHDVDSHGQVFEMKQVEMNAIAISFGSLSPIVAKIHRQMLARYGDESVIQDLDSHLPPCLTPNSQAIGMITAWKKYGVSNAIILFVVERRSINISDQRWVEFALGDLRPDIKVLRRSFNDLNGKLSLKGNKQLFLDDKYEVAVIYYRTGYAPDDYSNGESDWGLRLLMEQSKAIKCPTIQYHLSGVKKIQQIISKRDVLERFLASEKEVDEVMQTFTGLWGLELGEEGDKAVQIALGQPERFVLKPQREGGGNNYYGQEIVDKLNEIGHTKEREAYILMELIRQPKIANYLMMPDRSSPLEPVNIVCELGIFGVIMGDGNKIDDNYEAGHVLRSKISGVGEGGVAAGFGALDSPYLVSN